MGRDVIAENLVDEVTVQKKGVGQALVTMSTTAALAAVGNAINTANKYQGKLVLNTTTGIYVYANGAAAADTWKNVGTGVVAHTPV